MTPLSRRLAAEALGTAMLLAVVVGSGIMAERLADGNVGLALLANAIATAAGLYALILTLGPISGAHFNPWVTLLAAGSAQIPWRDVPCYWLVQVTGAIAGVWLAHAMFELPVWQLSAHARSGGGLWLSETAATFGLILVIASTTRHRPEATPAAVATYITSAYWFTASTAFANPAVTLARSLTDSFAGIALRDVPGFMAAQCAGLLAALAISRWLLEDTGSVTVRDAS